MRRRAANWDNELVIWALALILHNQRNIMATLEEANAAVQQLKSDIEAFLATVQPGQLTPEQQALVDNIAATAQAVDAEVVPPAAG